MHINKAWLSLLVLPMLAGPVRSETVWSDEFNGTSIDPAIWTYDVGGGGFGNGQLEYNTARSSNSYIEDGCLILEARREDYLGNAFTSARMMTQGRFSFRYGTLEARIQLPDTADGLWPAFWLLGNNFPGIGWPGCGEIDILEAGSSAGISEGKQHERINCALHFSNGSGAYESHTQWIDASDYLGAVDLSAGFHLYRMDWTPTSLAFYIDGVPFAEWDISAEHFSEYRQPHFPILNLAVGGWNYVRITDPAMITASFPARMKVDWIRLADNGYTEIFHGKEAAETGRFGVFTETVPVSDALAYQTGTEPGFDYGTNAALYLWNNMSAASPPSPSEGSEAWSFDIAAGNWFGMGVFLPNFRNMQHFSDGTLHFDLKTTSDAPLNVGIKSSRAGESWLPVGDESAEFGFARDGAWHTVSIPLNRYANIDFNTVHQMFMLLGNPPSSAFNLSIDNIWWEPGGPRPAAKAGSFGIFTETAENKTAGEFALGAEGDFFVWENTLLAGTQDPYEGIGSISLQSAPGPTWFGAAFTPNVKHDLSAFNHLNARLHVAMKTSSAVTFRIGMKSGNMDGVGQKWIRFQAGSDPYGFARDGLWHVVEIPVADLKPEVDFSQISQLFQILGIDGPIDGIELDDIYLAGGLASPILRMESSGSALRILWPASSQGFSLYCTGNLIAPAVWSPVTNTPVVVEDQWRIDMPADLANFYFRLEAP